MSVMVLFLQLGSVETAAPYSLSKMENAFARVSQRFQTGTELVNDIRILGQVGTEEFQCPLEGLG